ncbi:metastasis-associated protein MTA3-like [Clavelina lepadiformis]|uniref:Metastasis-associated protein MTA3 n=1 Tax=Clavelina lepadiformis TaxID=159417 RepID=A0ABP0GWF9_CLALP
MASSNMYRIGDYVYFENSSSNPYLIRRIEELNKTSSGNVEAKVICFYRRRDISNSLLMLADKHAKDMEEDMDEASTDLSDIERHQLNHRELYLSRQLDTLPATHIRGKCSVTLLNETEDLKSYLSKGDIFFYSLVYDPAQKTLLADKGEIRVGSKYQAEIPELLSDPEKDTRSLNDLEDLVWEPKNSLTEQQIDQFLVISRSVGTFARALDCSSSVRQPALHMTAAAASRDITLLHAMNCLHNNDYNFSDAITTLVPKGGPVLCKDEMEDWSPSEANLFEEALEKYGKDFLDIQQDFLPWKTLASIVEYYYMWKTSDRYVQQKRLKAADAESKLKQVYIPNYNKPNPNQIKMVNGDSVGKGCEGCFCTSSVQWYTWGPPSMSCRLCAACWTYWKKYGGLKIPPSSRLERIQIHKIKGTDKELRYRPPSSLGVQPISGARTQRASHKTKQAFFLNATKLTRLARRLCHDILSVRHFSRRPFEPISIAQIKAECQVRLSSVPQVNTTVAVKKWPSLSTVLERVAKLPPKVNQPMPNKKSLLNNNLKIADSKLRATLGNPHSFQGPVKRPHQNGLDNHVTDLTRNGSTMQRISNGPQKKKRCLNSNDSSDDILFVCNDKIREVRKQLKATVQRSAARRPTKHVLSVPGYEKHLLRQQAFSNTADSEPIVIDD